MLGDAIGDARPEDLVAAVTENMDSLPPEGASQAVMVGSGSSGRLAAIGRVPGPAGQGDDATIFAVLTQDTIGKKEVGVQEAINNAMEGGEMGAVPWPIVGGVGVLGLLLALWLPGFEGVAPQRRLANEFAALAEGTQKQIFHDTYGGATGAVARNAAQAHEALRGQIAEELANAPDEDAEEKPRRRPITRSTRAVGGRRGTRRNKPIKEKIRDDEDENEEKTDAPAAIELPDAPEDASLESHSQADATSAAKPAAAAAPAPVFSDEVQSDDSLVGQLGSELGSAGAPPPPAAAPPAPRPAPAPAPKPAADPVSEDPREQYFREIFEEFVQTKQACGENTDGFTYEKFARKLRKNTADLMKRPGTKDVKFSVYVKDGKAALKAKVVKD